MESSIAHQNTANYRLRTMGKVPLHQKSTTTEIRERFDADVERFSHFETGQSATIDAKLAMELTCRAAVASTPPIKRILDLGCGAGNYTLQLLQESGGTADCLLCDLSQPMLEKATERVSPQTSGSVQTYCGDFRDLDCPSAHFDVILAAAVLHHLRDDEDWVRSFSKFHNLLRPGGTIWIVDLVHHSTSPVQNLMWSRYGEYLEGLGGPNYRQTVFDYIEKEDSPRPLLWQIDLLRESGFSNVEILHKNSCFASFGGIRTT